MKNKLDKFLTQASKDLKKNKYMIGGIVGGIFGAQAAGKGERSARDAMSEILGNLQNVKVPTVEEQRIQLEMLKEAGIFTPEQIAEIQQDPARIAQIVEDPALKDIQLQVMEQMARRGQMGLAPEDRAALNTIRAQTAQQEKGSREAILQNMAARGAGGSGQELAAQLAASQGAAQTASQQGDAIASQASRNALEAIAQRANIAGQARSADFNTQAQNVQARNAVENFNTQLKANTMKENVGARNLAQQQNLGSRQRVMDENVGLKNQQEMYNKALIQQNFQNQMAKTGAVNTALGDKAQMNMQQGYNRAAMYGQMGGAWDKGAQDIAKMVAMGGSDERIKKDIHSGNKKLENFLSDIKKIVKKHGHFEGGEIDPSALEAFTSDSSNYNQVASSNNADTSNYGDLQQTGESTPIGTNKDTGMQGINTDSSAAQASSSSNERNPIPNMASSSFTNYSQTIPNAELGAYQSVKSVNPFMMAEGGYVPGDAEMSGDHIKNDVVPAALSPGEIVIPRSAVHSGRKGIDKFLDNIEAKSYKYKNPEKPFRGDGKYVSPMAQDLEKTELGKDMVINTPDGKVVDYGKGFGTLLASQALLKEKIDEIEKRIGKKNGKK